MTLHKKLLLSLTTNLFFAFMHNLCQINIKISLYTLKIAIHAIRIMKIYADSLYVILLKESLSLLRLFFIQTPPYIRFYYGTTNPSTKWYYQYMQMSIDS